MNRIIHFLLEIYDFFWGDLSQEELSLLISLFLSTYTIGIVVYVICDEGAGVLLSLLVSLQLGVRIWRKSQNRNRDNSER